MEDIKVINGIDFHGNRTEEMYLDVDHQYTIDEFIELLRAARTLWGNREIVVHDMNADVIGGFARIYLNHDPDGSKQICILA